MTLSLKRNVIAEPAVAGWYAWSYLLPPQTLAKYLKNHYRSIVESYLEDPGAHRTALKQARFQGGPFVHEQGEDAYGKIEHWYQDAREQYAPLLELADAIDELEQEILPGLTGATTEAVYRKLPEPLAGRVELFYGRDNRTPDYRFIEPLLYASRHFTPGLQQVRFSRVTEDARSFALTTPVLEYTPEQLLVTVPLDSPLLDAVFRGGLTPEELDRIGADLGLTGERAQTFRSFFEEDPDPSGSRPDGSGEDVIEYLGHACVFVRHRGTTFLVDPVVSYSGYEHRSDGRFTFDDLPERIDYVMITHNHQDHMLLETLLKIRHRVGRVVIAKSANSSLVDPDLKRILGVLGFPDVVELDDLDSLDTPGGAITALPFLGEHGDIRIRTKCGWLLDLDGTRVLFAADSTNVSPHLYAQVAAAVGPVDTVFIGMESVGAPVSWLYGPLFPERLERRVDAGRRLKGSNFEQAAAIVDTLQARSVYVYAMGQEPWLGAVMCIEYDESHPAMVDSDKLVGYVRERGGTSKRLFLHESIAVRP
ncbi:MBL fold metallo-hydrolase [Kitasatospora sp. NPDC057542]|uniref:MBL fold metallo-hydrolase n=1 Tax=Streptomycetaceae TaxID=2062 RepID=UPI001CD00339|nr:MBL fold metallo-hydrolase [Streptomyces sp. LS1784]